ncbi:hypothetical protein BGY98DRAFT_1188997 [Russula aff. rugulosa BPL654]|nr:hypothetical protein BGY98DRAFT_1188997 [Russula aff. rugulosa BPL654]
MSQSSIDSNTGPAAMPPPRLSWAPYFSGQVGDPFEDFLTEYEELADSCGLTGQQKVETIVHYIQLAHRDLWKSLDGYTTRNWVDLRRDLEDIYAGPSTYSCYSKQKLYGLTRYFAQTRISSEEDVLWYYQRFLILSRLLRDARRLSDKECDKAFWLGFHPRDRAEMYVRLIAKHPDQPTNVRFNYLDVYKAARATFSGNHLLDVELDDARDKPQGLRDRHAERAQEQWLDQEERDPQGVHPNYRTHEPRCRLSQAPINSTHQDTKHQRFDARRAPLPEAETKVVQLKELTREEEDRELEDLITRMRGLSPSMESYAVLHAQCARQFPNVVHIFPKPVVAQYMPTPAPAPVATFSLWIPTPPPPFARQPWPSAMNPHPVLQAASDPDPFFNIFAAERTKHETRAYKLPNPSPRIPKLLHPPPPLLLPPPLLPSPLHPPPPILPSLLRPLSLLCPPSRRVHHPCCIHSTTADPADPTTAITSAVSTTTTTAPTASAISASATPSMSSLCRQAQPLRLTECSSPWPAFDDAPSRPMRSSICTHSGSPNALSIVSKLLALRPSSAVTLRGGLFKLAHAVGAERWKYLSMHHIPYIKWPYMDNG